MSETRSKKKKFSGAPPLKQSSPKRTTSTGSSLAAKQFLLFLFAIILLLIYFSVGYTKSWFQDKILTGYEEFGEQKDKLDLESRMITRFGGNYTITKSLANFLIKRGSGKKLLLVPPNDYLAENKVEYRPPEPAIFYYFTGVKTVWANSEEAFKANWYLTASKGQILLDSVMRKTQLDSVIAKFRKYKISL